MSDWDERLAERPAAMQLNSAPSPSRPADLGILIPNPFGRRDEEGHGDDADDAEMPTASPRAGPRDGRTAGASALPQPPTYSGRTMQDRRDFMHKYEGYLVMVNALQTEWTAALAMPVSACIETDTRRMIALWEFDGVAPEMITEEQWIDYFRQALAPTFVDYASIDAAMKELKMQTKWPEPESRMMQLQAEMEAILNCFNATDLAFKHEQRRLITYLTNALELASFRKVAVTKLTLQEYKSMKYDAVAFSKYVVSLMRDFMTWEHAAEAAARSNASNVGERGGGRGNATRSGGRGGGGRGNGNAGQSGGSGLASGDSNNRSRGRTNAGRGEGRGGGGGRDVGAGGSASNRRTTGGASRPRGACLKCGSTQHQVLVCPNTQPGEEERLMADLRAQRAVHSTTVRRVEAGAEPGRGIATATAKSGAVEALVDGLELRALLLDTGADELLVAEGVVDAIRARGTPVFLADIPARTLAPIGGKTFSVHRAVTFREVELATSAGPLMLRNLMCLVEDGNNSLDFTLGRPIMTVLGYSTDELLVRARDTKSERELGGTEQTKAKLEPTALQCVCRLQTSARDIALDMMALEGLVDNSTPDIPAWSGSDTLRGGGAPSKTAKETERVMQHGFWQLPMSSSGAQVTDLQGVWLLSAPESGASRSPRDGCRERGRCGAP